MSNNNKTTAIRFKGFTDTWEQRELRTAATFSKGSGYSKNDLKENGTPIILYGRLYTKYETVISEVDTFVDVQPNSVYSTGHEVIVPASGETAEDISRASFVAKSGILLGGDLNIIVPDDYINPVFLALTISNGNQQKELSKRAQGKSVVHIHNSDLENVVLLYPKYEEQEKIGEYFSKLDTLITLHQRKCDKLIQFKAAMLKKMFPQNGADKPELRFKGFTDAWEQRKLGELMEITSVKRIHQSDWTDSGVRFLRARDIVAVSKNEEVSEPLFISQEKYDEYSALSGKVKIGDLLVTGVGTIGVPMLINNEEPLYFKDGNIIWFKNEDRIDGEFFYHSFNGSFIQNFIKESAGIGTVGTYTIESGKKTPILLPTQKDEQQKIGTFFSQLDTLITLHQRKCDKYKSIKAGLIRKFFP